MTESSLDGQPSCRILVFDSPEFDNKEQCCSILTTQATVAEILQHDIILIMTERMIFMADGRKVAN